MRLLLVGALGCTACQWRVVDPASVASQHTDLFGQAIWTADGATPAQPLRVSTDECLDHRVLVRLGRHCVLLATWVGTPSLEGYEDSSERWLEGAQAVRPHQQCFLDVAPLGEVAIDVEYGTATIRHDLYRMTLGGSISAPHRPALPVRLDFTGPVQGRRSPTQCVPVRSLTPPPGSS